jgi:hypothetical protein
MESVPRIYLHEGKAQDRTPQIRIMAVSRVNDEICMYNKDLGKIRTCCSEESCHLEYDAVKSGREEGGCTFF